MIITAIKHFIYEKCINVLFNTIRNNFDTNQQVNVLEEAIGIKNRIESILVNKYHAQTDDFKDLPYKAIGLLESLQDLRACTASSYIKKEDIPVLQTIIEKANTRIDNKDDNHFEL